MKLMKRKQMSQDTPGIAGVMPTGSGEAGGAGINRI